MAEEDERAQNLRLRKDLFESMKHAREQRGKKPCLCMLGLQRAGKSSSGNTLIAATQPGERFSLYFTPAIATDGTKVPQERSFPVRDPEGNEASAEDLVIRDFNGAMNVEELAEQFQKAKSVCDAFLVVYGRTETPYSSWLHLTKEELRTSPRIGRLRAAIGEAPIFPILTNPSLLGSGDYFEAFLHGIRQTALSSSEFENHSIRISCPPPKISLADANVRLNFLISVYQDLASRQRIEDPVDRYSGLFWGIIGSAVGLTAGVVGGRYL